MEDRVTIARPMMNATTGLAWCAGTGSSTGMSVDAVARAVVVAARVVESMRSLQERVASMRSNSRNNAEAKSQDEWTVTTEFKKGWPGDCARRRRSSARISADGLDPTDSSADGSSRRPHTARTGCTIQRVARLSRDASCPRPLTRVSGPLAVSLPLFPPPYRHG